MSPFKEPQPRKNSAAEDAKKVIGGNWPPYERQGGEANWGSNTGPVRSITAELREPATSEEMRRAEQQRTANEYYSQPLMVLPDYSPFELRKAALEAACALQGNQPSKHFWDNIEALETYLRDGTKPS